MYNFSFLLFSVNLEHSSKSCIISLKLNQYPTSFVGSYSNHRWFGWPSDSFAMFLHRCDVCIDCIRRNHFHSTHSHSNHRAIDCSRHRLPTIMSILHLRRDISHHFVRQQQFHRRRASDVVLPDEHHIDSRLFTGDASRSTVTEKFPDLSSIAMALSIRSSSHCTSSESNGRQMVGTSGYRRLVDHGRAHCVE